MGHTYNRRTFGNIDQGSPLLRLYCSLVAVELALKDTANSGKDSHDIVKMSKDLQDVSVDIAADGLFNALKALICTTKGQACAVRPDKYPDIRYLRHDEDFTGGTTSTALNEAKDAIHMLLRELNNHWSAINKENVIP